MRTRLSAFVCCLLLAACCLLTVAAPVRADIKLMLDVKEGDSIHDIAKITVRAESADNIDKVEFYVDDQLRYTAPSIPYVFTWDTIPDKEGMHTLAVTAFDGNGQTKKLSLSLMIDNELALGGDALAKKADDALKANDLPAAMKYCRRTLKADPGNPEGSRVLAGIYAAQGEWDKAVTTLEKSKNISTSSTAMLDLARFKTRRALLPENAPIFFTELNSIYTLRQNVAEMHTAEVIKKNLDDTPAAHEAIGDALLAAGRYHDALMEYRKSATKDTAPLSSVVRYALAQVYDATPEEAIDTLHHFEIGGGKLDAAAHAVKALALLHSVQYEQARAVIAPDLSGSNPAAHIVAAYADTALGKYAVARTEVEAATKAAPDAPEVAYAASMTLQKITEQEDALNKTLTLAPFQSAPYLDFAARVAVEKQPDRYDRALKFLDFVLKRDPKNANARLQQALIYLQTKRNKEAATTLNGLAEGVRQSPDVLAALGIYWELNGNPGASRRYTDTARSLDKARFDRSVSPTPMELLFDLDRKYRYRIGFFLTPDTLYPTKPTAAP